MKTIYKVKQRIKQRYEQKSYRIKQKSNREKSHSLQVRKLMLML